MRKTLMAILIAAISLSMLCACEKQANSSALDGTWQFYGIVGEGQVLSEDNIITGEELLDVFGVTEIPENKLTIDAKGIKELSGIPGSEVSDRENISDSSFIQKETITVVDGEKLDKPITATFTITLEGDYLFETVEYDDTSYSSDTTNVFKKVE